MNDARGSGSTNSVQSFLVSKATDSHSSAPHVLNDLEQRIRCQPSESKPEGPADPLVFFAAFWIASISIFIICKRCIPSSQSLATPSPLRYLI